MSAIVAERDISADLDKSFIDRLTLSGEGSALVRSVIDVTSALGLTSIAEGVEHQSQRGALDALGCDCIQGYLFAKPIPDAALARLLSSQHDRAAATET